MYGVDKKGGEHNMLFAAENDWITDIGSFYSEQASRPYIEAMGAAKIVQIHQPDPLYLYGNHPPFDRNFKVIRENQFVEQQNLSQA